MTDGGEIHGGLKSRSDRRYTADVELTIDRYEVRRLIGQGAMGKIYLAKDPKLARDVAIKMMSSGAEDPEVRKRFRLEARAVAALKHPNIVELYDYSGEHADDLFLVMEYVPGRTLNDHIIERGPMSEATALCAGHELALALEHAHAHEVVHRDLKPDNVILDQGRVVLMDFGVVKQVAGGAMHNRRMREAVHTQVLGTPGFMAPEQLYGRGVGPSTDTFALGALLYNLTTGRVPFEADDIDEMIERVKKGRFEDPRKYTPMLTEGFCGLLERCMRPNPDHRFTSVVELRAVVLRLLNGHGITEVRTELAGYERDPIGHAEEQKERRVGVLLRDLELAIKDQDKRMVSMLAQGLRAIAPLDPRIQELSGIDWSDTRPRLIVRSPGLRKWTALGFALGAVVGAAMMLLLLASGLIPTSWLSGFEELAGWLGLGG